MLISLLAQSATFARSGGRMHGADPGDEYVTLLPSGVVATVSYDYELIPIGEHIDVLGLYVDIVEVLGFLCFSCLPTEAGHYLVAAPVCDALTTEQRAAMIEAGIRLYTPRLLLFPGQPEHPGKEVLTGPFSPGLIRRV